MEKACNIADMFDPVDLATWTEKRKKIFPTCPIYHDQGTNSIQTERRRGVS